ncbi:MAG: hypothetical protein IJX98_06635 [Clostridia bacterium]|nr:hypothetical protein [Clostridia bacterium]
MKNIAVIDVGSNSVRLMFVADGKVLYKALETTRLGESIAATGLLSASAIERTANAVAAFYQKARNEGAQTVRAFATAAVRSSKNGGEFLKSVAALCPLQVEVISGEEEAKLGILGAIGSADGAMIDIGGASTELTVQKNGAVVYAKSVNVGAVRLKDLCGRDWEALQNYCENAVKEFEKIPQGVQFYAIGGTERRSLLFFLGKKPTTAQPLRARKFPQSKCKISRKRSQKFLWKR